MPHQTRYHALMITVACLMLLGITLATAAARMAPVTGTISAIEPAAQTVVIEFPQGQQKFTVGGPLSPKAVVKKGGKSAHLEDFHVGDQVRASWLHTANGHEITGFDHGVGHSLLLLYDVKAPNAQKSKEFKDLGHYLSDTSLSTF